MDTSKAITHVSLCAGYGGIDLGLRRCLPALRTILACEIEAYAVAQLCAKMEAGEMDACPIWTDVKTCPWELYRDKVSILSAGYPCPPFSTSGKRKGKEDLRHIWPHIQRAIAIIRPGFCFFENVEGHITLGLKDVVFDLGELGYDVTAGIFSAAEVGAPHQRKRIFILATLPNPGFQCGKISSWWKQSAKQFSGSNGKEGGTWPAKAGEEQYDWEEPRVVGNTHTNRFKKCSLSDEQRKKNNKVNRTSRRAIKSKLGGAIDGVESGVDAITNRVDRLRMLGNGVVPATAAKAFITLMNEIL